MGSLDAPTDERMFPWGREGVNAGTGPEPPF